MPKIIVKVVAMRIVLASANRGKIREIEKLLSSYKVVAYSDLLGEFDIIEDGDSFKANAIIKAKAIYQKLIENNDTKDTLVLSDDSGISVDVLDGEPGIYSARYAGVGVSDKDNLNKLINSLKAKGVRRSNAHYTAAMALIYEGNLQCVHGWMHGEVIDEAKGEGGFGYDPIFIPVNETQTLAELPDHVKNNISHRSAALNLMEKIIKTL
jgi:XTP/dITP diphosphohydrolase